MLAVQAADNEITTVESIAGEDGFLHPLQEAFRQEHALQCGFCTAGFLMTLIAFLEDNPKPTLHETREALSGNLCRCTGYVNIVAAVQRYVRENAS
jgi:aerobic-type carbon monoxide dehydrogenase small subunit (CoxS/CutS family)